jgi:hypothetical protein
MELLPLLSIPWSRNVGRSALSWPVSVSVGIKRVPRWHCKSAIEVGDVVWMGNDGVAQVGDMVWEEYEMDEQMSDLHLN